ncbi:MAG TPA: 50S ribosomal protein L23 [Thermoplasmatales archaeon]|nr:50S ribosomal protein L23 [Thermoplasmatales archaeon]HID25397.1 50S ribosomal protein L23 [Thermoplasmata archaeon]
MDPYEIILHPYVTEKTMDLMEKCNALDFVVNLKANKKQIKEAVEKAFDAKVKSVNIRITRTGKHAVVTFTPEYSAEEIGMRIGIF